MDRKGREFERLSLKSDKTGDSSFGSKLQIGEIKEQEIRLNMVTDNRGFN